MIADIDTAGIFDFDEEFEVCKIDEFSSSDESDFDSIGRERSSSEHTCRW